MTQYVYLNDTVTFGCATNLVDYQLFIFLNPSMSFSLHTVSNSNSVMVSFNLTARSEVNGTAVTCQASNGNATVPAYLYIQGQYGHQCTFLPYYSQVLLIVLVIFKDIS